MPLWSIPGKREVLLDVVTRLSRREHVDVHRVQSVTDIVPHPGGVSLIWQTPPSEPADFPTAIIGDRASLNDLIAWASTYVRGIGAISANSRLLLSDDLELLFQAQVSPSVPRYSTAIIALIIGEVLTLSDSGPPINEITISACKSTLAFLMARAAVLGRSDKSIVQLADQWERVHRLTNPTATIRASVLRAVNETSHSALQYLTREPSQIASSPLIGGALASLAADGENTPRLLSDIIGSFDDSRHRQSLMSMLELTPADRVKLFDVLAPAIKNDRQRTQTERAFALAAVASLCRPGVLQQFTLLRSSLDNTPEALLWFGIIQGLHRNNDVLDVADGLGRRVLRELLQKEWITDRPRSDIALMELEILARGTSLNSVRTNNASHISVEVQPGVYTLAKWRPHAFSQQRTLLDDTYSEVRGRQDPIEELGATLRHASNLLADIRKRSGNSAATEGRKGRRR
jgi:hypothetical protein